MKAEPLATTVDSAEIAKFSGLAGTWWDPTGPMAPLHALNTARIRYLRDQACAHFGRDARATQPLVGLRVLDVGCGAGLLAEPLTRLGASVTGVDASAEAIAAAQRHAEGGGLVIDYQVGGAAAAEGIFDVVVTMEVVEHVPNLDAFVAEAVAPLNADGLFVAATLNRTPKAFAVAIVGAEYLARLLPRGTHEYAKFIRPSEIAAAARHHGLECLEIAGLNYNPITGFCTLTRDPSVNYLVHLRRAGPVSG